MSIWTHSCSSQSATASVLHAAIPARDWSSSALPWLEAQPEQPMLKPTKCLDDFLPLCTQFVQYGPILPTSVGALNAGILAEQAREPDPICGSIARGEWSDNHAGSAQGDGPGDHERDIDLLTCVHPRKHASEVSLGVSVDQMLAQHYAGQTRFSSVK